MVYYTVYRTTNLVNRKFYIGVHKTADPYDSYLGSGKVLQRAVRKYGREFFRKKILFSFDTQVEAWAKEDVLVERHRNNPYCYNLRKGGSGGFDYINTSGLHSTAAGLAAIAADSDVRRRRGCALSKNLVWRKLNRENSYWRGKGRSGFSGRVHSLETRARMSERGKLRVGAKNSQYGTCWVTDGELTKKVMEDELADHLSLGWRRGRTPNPTKH